MAEPNLASRARSVSSRADFVNYVYDLIRNFPEHEDDISLETYLNTIARYARDIDGAYKNRGEPFPEEGSWRVFAEILFGAAIYD